MTFPTIRNTLFSTQVKQRPFFHRKTIFSFLDDFTDDVYFMHEELAHELEAQYEVNKTMYEQIEIWNELFAEFQEFEVGFSVLIIF